MGRLDGKVAIVVGAATGIGAATAKLMAKEGAKVMLADINMAGAEDKVAQIRTAGGEATACFTDIADEAAVNAMVAKTVDLYGGIDVLHNNAAALGPAVGGIDGRTNLVHLDLDVWHRTLAVNLTGYLLTTRAAIPEMLKRGGGSIINTSSGNALRGSPTRGAYCVSRAGVISLTLHIAVAYGKQGIRCNSVSPGAVITELTQRKFTDEFRRHRLRHYPTPRLGQPDDLAQAVLFLASDQSSWITGQVIRVDGGLLAAMPTALEDLDRVEEFNR